MKKFYPALLLLAFYGQAYAQTGTISIQIQRPGTNQNFGGTPQVVGDSTVVQVQVASTYQIDTVVASVPGRIVLLTYNPSLNNNTGGWTGTLHLLGLPQDTTLLTIKAVDVMHEAATASGQFIYDHPPTVTVDSPAAYTVARPTIGIRARCHSDSGSCTLTVGLVLGASPSTTLGTYTDSVNTTYDLSSYYGQTQMKLTVQATDRRGQAVSSWKPVFIETSPYLSVVFNAPTQIADFSGSRLLVTPSSGSPAIVNMTNDSVTAIPNAPGVDARLTSQGAVLGTGGAGGNPQLYDWNNGKLDTLGPYNGLVVAGNYGIWSAQNLMLRNFAIQTNQALPNAASNVNNDVTDSGVVVYTKAFNTNIDSVVRYYNGTTTIIGDNSNFTSNFAPLTDGKYVVYEKNTPGSSKGPGVYVYDGNTNYLVSDFSSQIGTVAVPQTYYQVNNGYVAYEKLDNNMKLQSWIRDPAGNNTEVTFFSNSSMLDLLNPRGDLLFFPPPTLVGLTQFNYRDLYQKGAGFLPVCYNQGKSYYQDSTWYIAIGRTLFRLNVVLTPNKSDSFSVNVKPDSLYGFSTNSFASHFEGSGTLMSVVFTRVPAHGTLKVNGVQVTVNGSVARSALQNLVYTPSTGFKGVDTVYWVGSNGYTSSVDTALLRLNVATVPPPAQPTISGLHAAYCSNGGTAVLTMTNFPDTSAGTVVTDSLDNQPLTIGANASCSITLAGLSAGAHAVKVTYTNVSGSSSVSQSFTVVAALTPVVSVSSDATTISGGTASVTVRASNVSGGGSSPQYTFALNRNFVPVLYGPGAADTVIIDTASLSIGVNMIYVRMQTSDSCYTSQTATDSIVITRTAPPATPPQPVIAGLQGTYCSNGGMANFTLTNKPDTGTTVSVTLDGAVLAGGSNGSYSIALSGLSTGGHTVKVTYTNTSGSSNVSQSFTVEAVPTPVVGLSADHSTISGSKASVVVTATNVSGGGSQPLYTFSLNRSFVPKLAGPGTADSVVIDTAELAIGANTVYVQMQSSDSCVTAQTAVDSVVITRMTSNAGGNGGNGNNNGNSSVIVNPNPFHGLLIVSGLQSTDSYTITLLNSDGMEIVKVRVGGVTQTQLISGGVPMTGIYLLRVYDETQGKVVRSARVLAIN
ncbi:T9SS type A sorting domain-containing protein [Puia dinghuensis]|uniref:T9SS C-terminal target domain-containing protein n=1 Tax=Puia dinghuensis TaxID=1792502 RepID=A0A8J2XWE4_9BACT|nr:T9SS type A sorting domain-containing protein [Puia dinghuensis]GGB25826.1 hypothetical protein GCM10011511_57200 [Puia dinghuensis]